MAEYIEREALLATYKKWLPQLEAEEDAGDRRGVETCIIVLEDAPAADVVEVKHGRWEPRMQDDGYGEYLLYFCSECGAVSPNSTRNYCQNCGADMRVGEEEKLERHSKEDGE